MLICKFVHGYAMGILEGARCGGEGCGGWMST